MFGMQYHTIVFYRLKLDNLSLTIFSLLYRHVAYVPSNIIVFAGAIQLRRWDSIKPTLILLCVFSGSASSGVIGILMPP